MQVVCSRDVKVAGLLGSAAAVEGKSSAVAEQQVGLGGTTKWKLASLVRCLLHKLHSYGLAFLLNSNCRMAIDPTDRLTAQQL